MKAKKAIGYNFIVGKDGKIYEGRGFRQPQTAGEGNLETSTKVNLSYFFAIKKDCKKFQFIFLCYIQNTKLSFMFWISLL